jgi:hypothetical protein
LASEVIMKAFASLLVFFGLALSAAPALADALPPGPCDGLTAGAACTALDGGIGTCKSSTSCTPQPCMVCDTSGASSSSSSGGTTSSSSSGGTGGGSAAADDSGGGCAMTPGTRAGSAALIAALALAGVAMASRRRR